jgi:Leucine-rich repeat (LRR) protein
VRIDTFEYTDGAQRDLYLESWRLDQCLARLTQDHSLGARIRYGDFREKNLECLRTVPWLERFAVSGFYTLDFSGIYELANLRRLVLEDERYTSTLDLDRFPCLEEVWLFWTPNQYELLLRCERLRKLTLRCFAPGSRTLKSLAPLSRLQSLTLDLPKIDSLDGIQALQELQCLEIHYGRILRDITALLSLDKCLRNLGLEVCRKMERVEDVIGELTSLRKLSLSRNAPLDTIAFIEGLPELEEFTFCETRIKDGNMEPCLRLKSAVFCNNRSYSHTFEQVRSHICSSGRL